MMPMLFALLALQAQAQENAEIRAGGKGVDMDYGPFLGCSPSWVKYRSDADLVSNKGICIRLAEEATYAFDPDLLRGAGGWTGGFLNLSNTHLTSYKGSLPPLVKGTPVFKGPSGAGWRKSGTPEDPRDPRFGPLPASVGRYEGLYRNGDRVILSYTVAGTPILEFPEFADGAFHRHFRVEASKEDLLLAVAVEEPELKVLVSGDARAKLEGGLVRVAASDTAATFTLSLRRSDAPAVRLAPDLRALAVAGPPRWGEALVTKGAVSKEKGPYVVDTLPAPESNPWKAWLRWTGLDFFSGGRAALCTWNGDVWIASGIDAGLDRIEWRRFAAGLYEPLGLRIVKDEVYVLCRDQITLLKDLNGDGEADFYGNFWNGLPTVGNYHAFVFELHTDSKGNFYCSVDGQRVDPEVPLHGCIMKIAPDGRSHEVLARGLRAPNGMSVGPGDEVTVSDNQGNWVPTSRLNLVKPGGFYGFVPHAGTPEPPKTQDPPLCWIPMGWDNSSGGQVWVTSDAWGPLKGRLLHTSYGTGSLFLVPFESVDGVAQGALQKFPLSFSSGIMRGRFHPKDGQLYVAGLKGWQTTGVKDPGLYRVRYTGAPVAMVEGMKAEQGKLSLTFTAPLEAETATAVDSWGVLRWNYLWTEKYGSNDYSVADPKKQVRDPVELKAVTLSPDGRTLTFEIPDLAPVMQMQVKGRIRTAAGVPLPVELHLTINRIR